MKTDHLADKTEVFTFLLVLVTGGALPFVEAWGKPKDFRLRVDFNKSEDWEKAKPYLLAELTYGGSRVIIERKKPDGGHWVMIRFWLDTCPVCNDTGRYVGVTPWDSQLKEQACHCPAARELF